MFRDFSGKVSLFPDRGYWRSGLRLAVMIEITIFVFATAACQRPTNTALTGEEYPHPGLPSAGGVSTAPPATVKSVAKEVSLTEDTVLTLSNTTVTIPAGAILEDSLASLSSYGGTFINTSSIVLQSEPVLLVISGADGNDLPRTKIHKDILVEVVSGKRASPTKLAMLFHEGGGLSDAVKTGISQTVLAPLLSLVSGSTHKALFEMRPPRVAIVMAQTGGSLPTGYEDFKLPPVEVTDLAGAPDSPADVTITWKSDANRNQGFAMVYAKAATVAAVCTIDDLIEPDFDQATGVYSYSVTGLDDDSEYTFKVCASSFRDPVDLSAGESVSVTTPKRALAVLTNTPADPTNATELNVTVTGDNLAYYRYALLSGAADCSSATYSSWITVATPITNTLSGDGARLLCVLGRVDPSNDQLIPTTHAFTVDQTPPVFGSIPLVNDVATSSQSVINLAEKNNTTDIVGSLVASSGYDAVAYSVTQATTCDDSLTYTSPVPTNVALVSGPEASDWRVCVRLSDNAGNEAYGSSDIFGVDWTPPVFTSLPYANATVSDGYINNSEQTTNSAVVAGPLAASGYVSADYAVVSGSSVCNASVNYSLTSVPRANDSVFSTDGLYKVCVRLLDAAMNPTFGASSQIIVKKTGPSFTSLARGDDVNDGYLSIAERATTTPLAKSLVASGYDAALYAVAANNASCSAIAAGSYGVMPANNSGTMTLGFYYKVCVKLTDTAGNPAVYGSTIPTQSFRALTSIPTCASVSRSGPASDGYINSTEYGQALDISTGVTSPGGTVVAASTQYAVIPSAATCNSSQTFAAGLPKSNNQAFNVNGVYKLCARVQDAVSQSGYCQSSTTITAVNNAITFTSIDRIGPAADGYINVAEHATSSAIVGNLVGSNYDAAKYAVVTSVTACDSNVVYGAAVPQANSSDLSVDGESYKVCVELSDVAGNPKAYGTSATFMFDVTAPTFNSVGYINAATDNYLNASERALTSDILGAVSGSGYSTEEFSVVPSTTTCGVPLSWSTPSPKANDSDFVSDGSYKVCVQITDDAGNFSHGESGVLVFDATSPVFTSIALSNEASDTYINVADTSSGLDMVGSLTASGQTSEKYLVTTNSSVCSAQAGYGAGIPTGVDFSSLNGDYKVCVELSDLAGNTDYGSSSVIHVDTTPPSFTSLALGADVLDGYLSTAEHSATTALAGSLVASGQDLAEYAVVTGATTCNNSVSYGVMPLGNDSSVSAHEESYKVCVKLTDVAGNPAAYGASSTFTALLTAPSCSSVALINAASDNYISGTEHGTSLAVTSGVTGGSSTVTSTQYVVISSTATCNSSQTFSSSVPKANDSIFGVNGTYKLCSKVADAASQAGYCESTAVTVVNNTITFTSIDLSGPATDGYINTTEHAASTAIAANLVGTNYDTAKYAVVTAATTCNALVTYGASVPGANSSDISADGTSYKVCVELSDTAGNPKAFGASLSFVYDNTAPSFTSFVLANAASDGYINNAEHALMTDVAGPLSSSGQSSIQYVLVTSSTTCAFPLSWTSAIPKANDALFTSVGNYKVCVQLTDVAGNTTYGNSPDVAFDNVAPVFTSISLANTAADTYVNAADSGSALAVVGSLSASGHSSVKYKVSTNAATCSSESSYGVSVPTGAAFSGLNGDYKVCVELSDLAGNTDYGSSSVIHVDTTPPSFTSLALGADVLDGYLSTAEHSATTALAGSLVASGQDLAEYAVVTGATTCNNSVSYGVMPLGNDSSVSAHEESYKVCVKLTDVAGNPAAYGASSTFTALLTAPSCSSVALINAASDNYISGTEHGTSLAVTSGVTGGSSTVTSTQYVVISSTATCNSSQTFSSSVPKANDSIFGVNGTYKLCSKVADAASQAGYCESTAVTVVNNTITFTSIDLSGPATDGYINTTEHAASTAIAANLVGTNYDTAKYAVVTAATTCNALVTYGASVPGANSSDISADGTSYKVCVELSDTAGNPKAFGASLSFVYDNTAPSFTSFVLANAASDGYINNAEHALMTDVAGPLSSSGQSSIQYVLVTSSTTCAFPLSWTSAIPKANDALFTSVGNYKVCVQLTDVAGNTTYGNSPDVAFDNVAPVFTSISLANTAADTYVNAADSGSALAVVGSLSATGQSSTNYKVATSSATCSSESSYGGAAPAASAFSGLNGDYKVCVQLFDASGNSAYGASGTIHVDTTVPSFTSVALAGDALDGYINSAESATSNALVSAAVGAGHDAVYYAVVTSITACSSATGWSLSIPQSNNATFSAIDSYKVCVKLSDAAGNPDAFGASSTIGFDNVAPSFSSLALAGDALDGYLNQTDRSNSTSILGALTATSYTSATYKMVLSATSCDASLTYGASINSNTSDITLWWRPLMNPGHIDHRLPIERKAEA